MEKISLPSQFTAFISGKLTPNRQGRPNFIKKLARQGDPTEKILEILEAVWLKNRSLRSLARKYETTYHTIWRLLQELEAWKTELIPYLQVPRRKVFYNRDVDSSDYETVQKYIRHAHYVELKKYREVIHEGMKIWRALNYADPGQWTQDDVDAVLRTYDDRPGTQYGLVTAVRALCPQLDETMKIGQYFDKIGRDKWDIFASEINLIHRALKPFPYEQLMFDLHITVGAREGKNEDGSGITGITWDRFKEDFTAVDDYESKVRKGIWWRDCPVDLFFADLPGRLKKLWISRGRPSLDPLIPRRYRELLSIYEKIREVLREFCCKGKVDPALLKQLTTIHPHAADKIHVNLLWEAGMPLEVVAGQYLSRGEGIGLVGRGWLSIETIRKYYLSLTRRSKRFQELRDQVRDYSTCFTVNKTQWNAVKLRPIRTLEIPELSVRYSWTSHSR